MRLALLDVISFFFFFFVSGLSCIVAQCDEYLSVH